MLHPFNSWDDGIVQVAHRDGMNRIVLREEQHSVGALVTTTYEFKEVTTTPEHATLLKSEYLFQIHHWLWRRTIAAAALSLLPQEMLKQTANIVRVCESLVDAR